MTKQRFSWNRFRRFRVSAWYDLRGRMVELGGMPIAVSFFANYMKVMRNDARVSEPGAVQSTVLRDVSVRFSALIQLRTRIMHMHI